MAQSQQWKSLAPKVVECKDIDPRVSLKDTTAEHAFQVHCQMGLISHQMTDLFALNRGVPFLFCGALRSP